MHMVVYDGHEAHCQFAICLIALTRDTKIIFFCHTRQDNFG
jgi:hypothetical protein